ncbi:MAG TPA: c-type cytochrome, partial [Gemmatimonadales bacterium]|nr:c-type cytochrome [Gemmatimonadales bacterium]
MPRWLRWIGFALLGLVTVLAVALVVVYVVSSSHLNRTYHFPDAGVAAATDSAALARGRRLAEIIGKCPLCHGADYGGKVLADNAAFGRLWPGNLTAGKGGIGRYTDADFERAIRHGVRQDGHPLVFMPSEAYGVMDDRDLAALIGYLRSLAPVDREIPAPRIGPLARTLYLVGNFPLLPVEVVDHTAPRPNGEAGVTVEYGRYLATVGGCRSCHGMA